MRALACLPLVLAACATAPATPTTPTTSLAPIAGKPMFLVIGLSPDDALAREARLLEAHGFPVEVPVRPGIAPPAVGERLLARTTPSEPVKEPCARSREVIELAASPREDESELRVVCFTEREEVATDGACTEAVASGCPKAGDRVVGLVASDAADLVGG